MTPDAVLDAPFLSTVPATTAFFIVLIAATMVPYALFMGYTLAGSALVAWSSLRGRLTGRAHEPIAGIVREWLPFAVSGAITAGIAPLLFVQVVYQGSFYTANLLLFNGWMAILPALMVAMWLLYLSKARHAAATRAAKATVAALAAALFVFAGHAFVENHLVSLRPDAWVSMHEGHDGVGSVLAWTRLALWMGIACTTLAALVAGQVLLGACGAGAVERATLARPLARLALGGLAGAALAWWLHAARTPDFERAWLSAAARPWLIVVACGAVTVVFGWVAIALRGALTPRRVAIACTGTVVLLLGAAMIREVQRLAALANTPAAARTVELGGGAVVFALAAVGGVAVVAWIIWQVRCVHSRPWPTSASSWTGSRFPIRS